MRKAILFGIILFLVGSAFSAFSFSIKFTKDITSTDESFKNDHIEITGASGYDKFNVTGDATISQANISKGYSIGFNGYGSKTINVTVYNSSDPSQNETEEFTVKVVYCKGKIDFWIDNDSSKIAIWPTLHVYNFSCDNSNYFSFSSSPLKIVSYKSVKKDGPFNYSLLLNYTDAEDIKEINITVEETNDGKVVKHEYNVSLCEPTISNEKTCPGEKFKLNLTFSEYCTKTNNVDIVVKNETGVVVKNISDASNGKLIFDNVWASGTPNCGEKFCTNIKSNGSFYSGGVPWVFSQIWNESYTIDMNPYVGILNASNKTVKISSFDCYDQNELPVPCNFSYLIPINITTNGINNFNFSMLMNVTYPNGYTDQYAKEVTANGGKQQTYFGFDGHTNDTCNYTISHDIYCNNNKCYSRNIGDSFSTDTKFCTTKPYKFRAPCPAPTIQKRWHDVRTIALPIHFTFGIYNKEENYKNVIPLEKGSNLYRLAEGKIENLNGNVWLKVFRYNYSWSLSPVDWIVQVFARKDFVPIRIGFNQTLPQTLNGVGSSSSMCVGKSVCYTEVPLCGDGVCDTASGESCKTCPQDCACGVNTKGCYGIPNIENFTDQRGCIMRYKKYEEPCYTDAECGSQYGQKLYCIHEYVGRSYHPIGHCCAKDEIWDPTTPPGFGDANPAINGTCRVPRGVWIENISVNDFGNCPWSNCDNQLSVCNLGYSESISDTKIVVKVHTEYPHDRVCAGFGTEPDKCCNDNSVSWYGGATQYCIDDPDSNEVTFTFRMNDRAPHAGVGSGIERRCNSNQPMIFFAYLPYELTNMYQQNTGINVTTYGNATLQYSFTGSFADLLNQWGDNKLVYATSSDSSPYGCVNGYSHIISNDSDNHKKVVWFYPFGGCNNNPPDWRKVNGHIGNILKDSNGEENWAEVAYVYNSGSDSCSNKKTAGWYEKNVTVVFPPSSSHGGISFNGRFVCGGHKMTPWSDW